MTMALPGMVAARVDANLAPVASAAGSPVSSSLVAAGRATSIRGTSTGCPRCIRGPYRPIATAVPGMRISELNTRLATPEPSILP